jgi:23S rRNA pseudouridine1911/1915/1917 synthase
VTLAFEFAGTKGTRLDAFLMQELSASGGAEISRSQLKRWIEEGHVAVNDKTALKAGLPLKPGDLIHMEPLVVPASHLEPMELPLKILYEDADIIVVDKPAGLSMHPGAGERRRTLVNALVGRLTGDFGDTQPLRPGIVHRLDKATTGVVVVARNIQAQRALIAQFSSRTVKRAYLALVYTTPRAVRAVNRTDTGTVDGNIGRDPKDRVKMAVRKDGGRKAVTHWKVVERLPYGTLLDVRLQTGRTHQIRVHMNAIGSPVIGDRSYGDFSGLPPQLRQAQEKFGRQALHAFLLGFTHPRTGKEMEFKSELPEDFRRLLAVFREASKS